MDQCWRYQKLLHGKKIPRIESTIESSMNVFPLSKCTLVELNCCELPKKRKVVSHKNKGNSISMEAVALQPCQDQ